MTRAELLDDRDAARDEAHQARQVAAAAVDELADVLVVLARWGVDIDAGNPAACVEYALRVVADGHPPPPTPAHLF